MIQLDNMSSTSIRCVCVCVCTTEILLLASRYCEMESNMIDGQQIPGLECLSWLITSRGLHNYSSYSSVPLQNKQKYQVFVISHQEELIGG